jgi:hypothetical protein
MQYCIQYLKWNSTISDSIEWTFLERLVVTKWIKKFFALHGTPRFINVFTTACDWPLPRATYIQSTSPHPLYLRYTLMLSCHLCISFPIGLPFTFFLIKHFYPFLISSMWSTHSVQLILIRTWHIWPSAFPLNILQFKNSLANAFAEAGLQHLTLTLPNVMSVSRYLSCCEETVEARSPV